ncbi:farnesol dehydrogenase-like [Condylostylus longicornis]|uniref:farnesol dehydrogenase-like n=1 Tax=Condylostylus longicornis TaxID=2530218 RepID=UPI00244DDC4C|nr:farnesol dehydrogenase-like [Condylostylus longicornis]
MERWHNKVAIVTGASAGIGVAIVKDLIKFNIKVIGLARRVHKIEEIRNEIPENLHKNNLFAKKCDVSKESEVIQVFNEIINEHGSIDILINNAGYMESGDLSMMNTQSIRDVLNTNVMGIVYCTQQAFKNMKTRNFNGHVILINSIAGHRITAPVDNSPSINIYSPSKYAVTAMTEVYRQEFSDLGTKCKITSISPGLTNTAMLPEEWKKFEDVGYLNPEDISNCVMFALSTPSHVQIFELTVLPVGKRI